MANFNEFISSIRQDYGAQRSGKIFETFCKWFLENDPEWSKKVDKVWLWEEYPHKWQNQDLGTDLVFQDRDGKTWAVQAKCYAEHRTTTKKDMNSFLADTGRKKVDRRLWLQTTNKISPEALKTCKGQEKPVTIFNLKDFQDAHIRYPTSFSELKSGKSKHKPIPEPHQAEAIKHTISGFLEHDRGQLIMACGTGKTFTSLWICEALQSNLVLVLLPSLSLLSQTMREWAWAAKTDFEILNVCSDKSVGVSEDLLVWEAPFPVSADVIEIKEFLKKSVPRVVFCTYQSLDLITLAQKDQNVPGFDLVIADEAHRCAGRDNSTFSQVLHEDKIRAQKRLFATATPRYISKSIKDTAESRDLTMVSMDDEVLFGPVFHRLTFGEAIERDLLTDYQVVIIGVNQPMVRDWIIRTELLSSSEHQLTDARTLASQIGLIKAVRDYDLRKVITFHNRVSAAKQFSEDLLDTVNFVKETARPDGEFFCDFISGKQSTAVRKKKIDHLKNLDDHICGILTNARCLSEGVDVPSLDGIAFINPKGSQIDIIQAVGRAIRKVRGSASQKKGTILLPVFIEDGKNAHDSIQSSEFKGIWNVITALRAHDEFLGFELDAARRDLAQKKNRPVQNQGYTKIILDLPTNVTPEFSDALHTILVEQTTSSWEFWFELLSLYKNTHGHCRVPQNAMFQDYKLGKWVQQQRQRLKYKTIPKERISRLDSVGFTWNVNEYEWEFMFEKLDSYYANTHTSLVPLRYDKSEPRSLGVWVNEVRAKYRKNLLTPEQVAQFTCFHDWRWDFDDWDETYDFIKNHCEKHHLTVSQIANDAVSDLGYSLKNWLNSQRKKGNKDQLSLQRKKLLTKLPGWFWNDDDKWLKNYQAASIFSETHRHLRVPRGKLNTWIKRQRKHRDQLSQEQQDLLNNLPGWSWDPFAEAWVAGIKELKAFHLENGHMFVPQRFVSKDGFNLGIWVNKNRIAYKKDKLPVERVAELETMESWVWEPLTYRWEEIYTSIQNIMHTEVDYLDTEIIPGVTVKSWLKIQRANIKRLDERKRNLIAKL